MKNLRKTVRWMSYLGLPAAMLLVIVGQSRDVPAVSDQAVEAIAPRTRESEVASLPMFQAVTDGTTELGLEEMPAYWHLLGKLPIPNPAPLQGGSLDGVNATHGPSVNDLLQAPTLFRGETLELTINVRRVLKYDVEENPLKAKQLFEVWGWLDDSPEQLVVVVTDQLPAGMTVGATVFERATVLGRFFKLQGYLPAGAQTTMSPLSAPLIVGRLEISTAPQRVFAHDKDWWRIGAGTVLLISFVGTIYSRSYVAKTPKPQDGQESEMFEAWLDEEERS